jgi:hypothetical protein
MASMAQLATLEELVTCFEDLEDPRSGVNRKHPLVRVVSISLMQSLLALTDRLRFIAGP